MLLDFYPKRFKAVSKQIPGESELRVRAANWHLKAPHLRNPSKIFQMYFLWETGVHPASAPEAPPAFLCHRGYGRLGFVTAPLLYHLIIYQYCKRVI